MTSAQDLLSLLPQNQLFMQNNDSQISKFSNSLNDLYYPNFSFMHTDNKSISQQVQDNLEKNLEISRNMSFNPTQLEQDDPQSLNFQKSNIKNNTIIKKPYDDDPIQLQSQQQQLQLDNSSNNNNTNNNKFSELPEGPPGDLFKNDSRFSQSGFFGIIKGISTYLSPNLQDPEQQSAQNQHFHNLQ
eukprot:TRINITY_DN7133_c0_g2_i1.p1 TRINITY_DN7133_c0_g2~~TRINITY_DN7133_c0_g2_i1.p1  ORF type:complete len:186 (+),score=28.83 TRINITY_DN7133_c0_g2_i1:122-679(+)